MRRLWQVLVCALVVAAPSAARGEVRPFAGPALDAAHAWLWDDAGGLLASGGTGLHAGTPTGTGLRAGTPTGTGLRAGTPTGGTEAGGTEAGSRVIEAARAAACPGGGGRGAPVPAGVCFILGVVPGLGMGHLIGGDIGGFTTWIVIDVVVLVALVAVTTIVPSPLEWIGWAGYLVLHVFQGFSALDSCGGRNPFVAKAPPAAAQAPILAGTPRPRPVEGVPLAHFSF